MSKEYELVVKVIDPKSFEKAPKKIVSIKPIINSTQVAKKIIQNSTDVSIV